MIDSYLELLERTQDTYSLFNRFCEKYQSSNLSQIIVTTKKQLDDIQALVECLDERIFNHPKFEDFLQNKKNTSTTYVNFQIHKTHENLSLILTQLLNESQELKKQTDTIIIKLPDNVTVPFNIKTNLNKTFISTNLKKEIFMMFTNNIYLIELYEELR